MKKLFCTALLACFMQAVHAQTTTVPAPHATATKEDDTILLELTATPEASWQRLAQVLVQRGYSIEHSNKDLLTLSTYPLFVPQSGVLRVAGTVVKNTFYLRVYWGGNMETGSGPYVLARQKSEKMWRELEAIAREFGGSIRYTTSAVNIDDR
ncbi:hypothetical protein MTX78_09795 [Hymenobacter tibetensis]|uniref:DUF4136 domain-containing protein n=1 Tax=Hymenobacter tibetensis TaxID=497967 RepID=A0ABY4D4B8_9BACT|nr:hypothetical protein [Hymenobacter tibetensis]UOG76872.1 hypothetical protein MTX78_09795 [Hymenobacter tibetensis]